MNRLDSPNYFLQALIFNMQDRVRSAVLLYPPLKEDSLLDLLSVLAHFDIFF